VRARESGTLHRNFQGYSTHAELDLVALGVSAISKVGPCYAQNIKKRHDYYEAVDAGHLPILRGVELTPDDLLRRDVIHALMCNGIAEFAVFEGRYGIRFATYFRHELAALAPLAQDGLVTLEAGRLRVTPKGRFLLRPIAMAFDAYLSTRQTEQRYSKVI
jgi:oxygen-independent coproporphyrinogen-3 oxidase